MSESSKHLTYLKTAVAQGKLGHAYLFSGNDREEKEKLVAEFVSFLLGGKVRGADPDVMFVNPENGEIGISHIRKLKERLSYRAWSAPYKVGIIKEAERMNQEAQSAFLKILEEPKGDTLFLLQVSHAELLLDTIRSRAQELKLYAFDKERKGALGLLEKLRRASLADRFAFAQDAAGDPQKLQEVFLELEQEARRELHEELKGGKIASIKFLRVLQETLRAVRGTRVNLRLAAERVLLEL